MTSPPRPAANGDARELRCDDNAPDRPFGLGLKLRPRDSGPRRRPGEVDAVIVPSRALAGMGIPSSSRSAACTKYSNWTDASPLREEQGIGLRPASSSCRSTSFQQNQPGRKSDHLVKLNKHLNRLAELVSIAALRAAEERNGSHLRRGLSSGVAGPHEKISHSNGDQPLGGYRNQRKPTPSPGCAKQLYIGTLHGEVAAFGKPNLGLVFLAEFVRRIVRLPAIGASRSPTPYFRSGLVLRRPRCRPLRRCCLLRCGTSSTSPSPCPSP